MTVFDTATGLQTVVQTAQLAEQVAQTAIMLEDWQEKKATAKQWEARNSAEYGVRGSEFSRQLGAAGTQKSLKTEDIGLDKKATGLEQDKLDLSSGKLDLRGDRLKLDDRQFDIAGAAAATERAGVGAVEQADEEAAKVGGRSVRDYSNFLSTIGARAGDYEDEAKAFTDPLLAAVPGTTVGGSRYGGDFAAASGPAAYARDDRKAAIAAFAEAMGQSTDSLAGIDIAQSGVNAQQDKINKEMGLAGADQSLAGAGLRNKGVQIDEDELDIDRDVLGVDYDFLGVDRSKQAIDKRQVDAAYADIAGKLGSQRRLDDIAQGYKKTLHGQQQVLFPANQLFSNVGNFAKALQKKPGTSGTNYGTYGSGAQNEFGVGTYNPKSGAGGF
jgi:hypothetical protein